MFSDLRSWTVQSSVFFPCCLIRNCFRALPLQVSGKGALCSVSNSVPLRKGIITGVCNEDLTAGSLQDANCEEHSVQEPRWELVRGTSWSWKRLFENYRSKHELQRHLKGRFSVASDIWTLKTVSDASYSLPHNPKIKFRGQFWVNCCYCEVIKGFGL